MRLVKVSNHSVRGKHMAKRRDNWGDQRIGISLFKEIFTHLGPVHTYPFSFENGFFLFSKKFRLAQVSFSNRFRPATRICFCLKTGTFYTIWPAVLIHPKNVPSHPLYQVLLRSGHTQVFDFRHRKSSCIGEVVFSNNKLEHFTWKKN